VKKRERGKVRSGGCEVRNREREGGSKVVGVSGSVKARFRQTFRRR